MRLPRWMCVSMLLCSSAIGCSGGASGGGKQVKLHGSGASFPAPLYNKWFKTYNAAHPDLQIDYQSTGSGSGVKAVIDKTVDFGASDAAMTPEEIQQVDVGVQLLPMTAGSIVLAYNVPGVDQLKLSRAAYVAIFLGQVTKWNDPLIAESNPDVTLPASDIHVVVRADSSGTTFVFTNHLNAIHAAWQTKHDPKGPGAGKQIDWPTDKQGGLGGRGNAGVAAVIQMTPGAIGYTETSYAELAKLPIARLQNKEGEFTLPDPENNLASLSGANLQKFFDHVKKTKKEDYYPIEITNPEGKTAYPIVTFTWMIVSQRYKDERTGNAIKDVLEYCLTEGQKISPDLGYISLPPELAERVLATVRKIKVGGE